MPVFVPNNLPIAVQYRNEFCFVVERAEKRNFDASGGGNHAGRGRGFELMDKGDDGFFGAFA